MVVMREWCGGDEGGGVVVMREWCGGDEGVVWWG